MSTRCPACGFIHPDNDKPQKGRCWPCTGESVTIILAGNTVIAVHRTPESAKRWLELVIGDQYFGCGYRVVTEAVRSDV
jgi:hypothetical protein